MLLEQHATHYGNARARAITLYISRMPIAQQILMYKAHNKARARAMTLYISRMPIAQ